MATGGFSEVARQLSERYGQPVSRQQVYQWWKRRTLNADGKPFPREAEQGTVPYHKGLAKLIDLDEALAWAKPGVPGANGNQRDGRWRKLGAE
jgi:hypothetical protein